MEKEKEKEKEKETITVQGQDLIQKIKEIIRKGNVNKILIKREGEVKLSIPVNTGLGIGMIAIILAPFLAILVGLAAIAIDYTLEIERPESNTGNNKG